MVCYKETRWYALSLQYTCRVLIFYFYSESISSAHPNSALASTNFCGLYQSSTTENPRRDPAKAEPADIEYTVVNDINPTSTESASPMLDGQEHSPGRGTGISSFGIVNPSTSVFEKQMNYDKVLKRHGRILARREKLLGPDHALSLFTAQKMAALHDKQKNYCKAINLYERILAGREKLNGPDHVFTLSTVNKIAALCCKQEDYYKALINYRRVMDGRERTLGRDHLRTLEAVYNVTSALWERKEYTEMLSLYERILSVRYKILGPDHSYDHYHRRRNSSSISGSRES